MGYNKDQTNANNMKMLILYIITFVVCIVLVLAMSILFGNGEIATGHVSTYYDKPGRITYYHDHRL